MGAEARFTRTTDDTDDTVDFFEPIFAEVKPDTLITDSGGEFAGGDAGNFYEAHDVKWKPMPADNPEVRVSWSGWSRHLKKNGWNVRTSGPARTQESAGRVRALVQYREGALKFGRHDTGTGLLGKV